MTNVQIMSGYLVAAPTVGVCSNGDKRAVFSIPNPAKGKTKQYIQVVTFGKMAENVEHYTYKGCKVTVTGSFHMTEEATPKPEIFQVTNIEFHKDHVYDAEQTG